MARNYICGLAQRSFVRLKQAAKKMFKIFIKHQKFFDVEERCAIVKKRAGNYDIIILSFPIEEQRKGSKIFVDVIICKQGLTEKIEIILTGKEMQYYFNNDLAREFGFNVLSMALCSREAKNIDGLIIGSLNSEKAKGKALV